MFRNCNIQSSEHKVEITFTCVPYRTGCVVPFSEIPSQWRISYSSVAVGYTVDGRVREMLLVSTTYCTIRSRHTEEPCTRPSGISVLWKVPRNCSPNAVLNLIKQVQCRWYGRGIVHWHNRNVNQGGKKRQDAGENYILASNFVTGTLLKRLRHSDMMWGGHVACFGEKIAYSFVRKPWRTHDLKALNLLEGIIREGLLKELDNRVLTGHGWLGIWNGRRLLWPG
jgi:hypothetical protein